MPVQPRSLRVLSSPRFQLVAAVGVCLALAAQSGRADESSGDPAPVQLSGRVSQRFEIYNPHSREQLEALRQMGFTQVILDWPTLHADAAELGLDVVLAHWWTVATNPAEIDQAVEFARQVDPQRLVGFSMMDEPERNSPETSFQFYRSLYQDVRAYFDRERPGTKIELSHWGPLASWEEEDYRRFVPLYRAADRMRLMPYPDLDEGPLDEVFLQMVRSRRVMQLAGRELPWVVILQTWVLPEEPKLPTIDELRVMAYCAMLGGAETVSFFSYDPAVWDRTPGFTAGFTGLMDELRAFRDQYGGAPVQASLGADGVLTAQIRMPGGSVSVVVNTKRAGVGELAALAIAIQEPAVAEQGGPAVVAGRAAVPCQHRPKRGEWRRRCKLRRLW